MAFLVPASYLTALDNSDAKVSEELLLAPDAAVSVAGKHWDGVTDLVQSARPVVDPLPTWRRGGIAEGLGKSPWSLAGVASADKRGPSSMVAPDGPPSLAALPRED